MAHPAMQAPATLHWQHPSVLPPEGVPANVVPGDTASVLPAPPHGAAAIHRAAIGLAAPAVSPSPL